MKVGESIKYQGYEIERSSKEDFITLIAHDTLKDAKDFIDRLIEANEIISPEEHRGRAKT